MAPPTEAERALARTLAQTADPRDAYARALGTIGEILGWRAGAVWEPALDAGGKLSCVETWHEGDEKSEQFISVSRGTTLETGVGLPGRVWETGEPAWIADLRDDTNFPRAAAAERAGLRSGCCLPLRSARGVVGVIEFFTADVHEPDAELLATMANLGDQIGQTVERRRDLERLQASEARHRAMLDAALDCVVTMNHEGRVVDFNPAAERTFGYAAEVVIGREMAELIVPPELRDRHRAGLRRYLDDGQPLLLDRRIEIVGMRADGNTFPVELTITRIDVPGPPMFTGYLRDITDRKQAEAELRASRARIVAAADEARRQIERDLHDGAQQRLVELALDLRMARRRLDGDGEASRLLDAAIEDLADATRELRELARGIHPAALTEGGLRPALEGLVRRSNVAVRLTTTPGERFPAPVEATAYFVVAEALTNVSRYARARRAEVEVSRKEGALMVEVRDDGRGGADLKAGSGLQGLADRVAALGGRLEVNSPLGEGTRLRAEIPCES